MKNPVDGSYNTLLDNFDHVRTIRVWIGPEYFVN